MIMKVFLKRLPSKIKQNVKSLEDLSADDCTKVCMQYSWSVADQPHYQCYLLKYTSLYEDMLKKAENEIKFPLFQAVSQGYIKSQHY